MSLVRLKRRRLYWFVALALFPILVALLYILFVRIEALFRYDDRFFTPSYQEIYSAPGPVAIALEQALQSGNQDLYNEITALRSNPETLQANPDMIMTIMLEADDAGYFHYLYLDMETFRRLTYYVKEQKNRFVMVPEGPYFYLDSGAWLEFFTPLALVWWLVLIVYQLGNFFFRVAARIREERFRGT
ncbi:MAG: hypothetical protein PVG14_11035 [Anaerolineales bacterium]